MSFRSLQKRSLSKRSPSKLRNVVTFEESLIIEPVKKSINKNDHNEVRRINLKKLGLKDGSDITVGDIKRALKNCKNETPGKFLRCKLAFKTLVNSRGELRYTFGRRSRRSKTNKSRKSRKSRKLIFL
jgi:hypothetical protein